MIVPRDRLPFLRLLLIFASFAAGCCAATELTRAIDVRSLSLEEAQAGVPVKLRATVTFQGSGAVFIEDETASTFFIPSIPHQLSPGDIVEVTGRTFPGMYLPGIKPASFRVVGKGKWRSPVSVTYDELRGGRYHYQQVAVEGIARSVTPDGEGRSLIRIALGTHVVEAQVTFPIEDEEAIVDSEVRVEGLAAGGLNRRRQLVQPQLLLSAREQIEILRPPASVGAIPQIAASNLATFRPSGPEGHRVRLRGVVTAQTTSSQVYIRSEGTPLAIHFSAPTTVNVGDDIDVAGFGAMDKFTAVLVDAQLLERVPGRPPSPKPIGVPQIMGGTLDADLLSVTARLSGYFRTADGVTLSLQQAGTTLQVLAPVLSEDIPIGSLVRVVGICEVESSINASLRSQPTMVRLRATSKQDISVVNSPPWWTVSRLVAALMSLLGITLLAVLWILVLRRQVRQQTQALGKKMRSEAALEERQRIARDFHDSLQQDLTGLSLRLAAASARMKDAKGSDILNASSGLLSRIQSETRNLVSDLRDTEDVEGDLASALRSIAALYDGNERVELSMDFAAQLPTLPVGVMHHLRMMLRESLTNALKHAQPRHISIGVVVLDEHLEMRITDDGRGFDISEATSARGGHFGCIGLRERARKIGATITWQSVKGQGTAVEIVVPLRGLPIRLAGPKPFTYSSALQNSVSAAD
jgi:signal transduction histidine kinase